MEFKSNRAKQAGRLVNALQTNIRETNNSVETRAFLPLLLLRVSLLTRDEEREKRKTAGLLEEK